MNESHFSRLIFILFFYELVPHHHGSTFNVKDYTHNASGTVIVAQSFPLASMRWHGSHVNKAGYTATPVACGWAGAIFEATPSFGQEQ